jgi:hypothetical protein
LFGELVQVAADGGVGYVKGLAGFGDAEAAASRDKFEHPVQSILLGHPETSDQQPAALVAMR